MEFQMTDDNERDELPTLEDMVKVVMIRGFPI